MKGAHKCNGQEVNRACSSTVERPGSISPGYGCKFDSCQAHAAENDNMSKSPFPALIYGWPFDVYTAFKAEHFSALKAIEESPRHYLSKTVLAPSPALRLGRAIH